MGDLGDPCDMEYVFALFIDANVAPTEDNVAEMYLAFSPDNSNWPGGVSGSDAVFAGKKEQLVKLRPFLTQNTTDNQMMILGRVRPSARYVVPVVINTLGQALAAAGNSYVIAWPVSFHDPST